MESQMKMFKEAIFHRREWVVMFQEYVLIEAKIFRNAPHFFHKR